MQEKLDMNETKRVFIALPLPQEIQEKIWESTGKKLPKGQLSVVDKGNLHVTLCFLGNRTPEEQKKAEHALEKIKQKPFEVGLFGISHFDKRVLFLQITSGAGELEKISMELAEQTGMCEGKFHSHVTLARNKKMRPEEFVKFVEKLGKGKEKLVFLAKETVLFESRLSPRGAVYAPVFSKELEE
ncbi:MAG: RNA 2',3'-cyclic phosphodiesterase [archaeon]|nr:RNA 2',3'-cyclic phosphodiesterase [archaeon]